MIRGTLKANLLFAFSLVAFAVTLTAAPTLAGRDVTLSEAGNVQGAASCGGPAGTMSAWCSIECTWACFSTGCAACGCPETADTGSGGYQFSVTPCGTAGCGSKPFYLGTCSGS